MTLTVRAAAVLFICALLLPNTSRAATAVIPAKAEIVQTPLPLKMAQSCVRLRLRTEDREFVTTGFGAAFGIDLAGYGLKGSRHLLSAAHLILNKTGDMAAGDLAVELPALKSSRWSQCKVVAYDKERDLCLLECEADIPVISQLNTDDHAVEVDSAVMLVGCPSGAPPRVSYGWLTDKEPNVKGRLWEASASFYHGNSGGPVFDAIKGKVIGVAVAGVNNGSGDMDRNIALFAPYFEVKTFLDKALKK
jgi:S1-C subfamily serine protease